MHIELCTVDEANVERSRLFSWCCRLHAGRASKRLGDLDRISLAPGNDVNVGNDFIVTTDRARHIGAGDSGVLLDAGEQCVRLEHRGRIPLQMHVATHDLDPFEDPFRRLLPELRQLGQLAILGDSLEILDRLNSKCLVDYLDLGGAESGDTHQLEQPFGESFAQLFEVGRLSRFDQLAND